MAGTTTRTNEDKAPTALAESTKPGAKGTEADRQMETSVNAIAPAVTATDAQGVERIVVAVNDNPWELDEGKPDKDAVARLKKARAKLDEKLEDNKKRLGLK